MTPLAERVDSLRAWAESRIRACCEQEAKFVGAWLPHQKMPHALVEAWTERRALEAVLRQLEES